MSIIVVGDLHLKDKEPYFTHQKNLLNWLNENFKDYPMVLLGDEIDNSSPKWEVFETFINFLQKRNAKTYILNGNHTYSRLKGNLLLGIKHLENVKVFFEFEKIMVEELDCLFLPYGHEELYELIKDDVSIVFAHITHPEEAFGSEGVNLKNIHAGLYIYGHTHTQNIHNTNHIILGVPLPTRHLEHLQKGRIMKIEGIEKFEFFEVPEFFTFEDVEYGFEPKNKNNILNVLNAPSIQSVYELYKDYHIREEGITIQRDKMELAELEDLKSENRTISQEFIDYSRDKNIDKEIQDCCLKYLEGV